MPVNRVGGPGAPNLSSFPRKSRSITSGFDATPTPDVAAMGSDPPRRTASGGEAVAGEPLSREVLSLLVDMQQAALASGEIRPGPPVASPPEPRPGSAPAEPSLSSQGGGAGGRGRGTAVDPVPTSPDEARGAIAAAQEPDRRSTSAGGAEISGGTLLAIAADAGPARASDVKAALDAYSQSGALLRRGADPPAATGETPAAESGSPSFAITA